MNITDNNDVKSALDKTVGHFGNIDVIVNNAGYGQLGTLEELSDAEARANFDVNVFGTLNVIRNAMPYLRGQKSGNIFNISSVGGYYGGFPGWGVYCSTKFAVAGFTEALAEEARFRNSRNGCLSCLFPYGLPDKDSVKRLKILLKPMKPQEIQRKHI